MAARKRSAKRDVEKDYPSKQLVAKLRRLADCIEHICDRLVNDNTELRMFFDNSFAMSRHHTGEGCGTREVGVNRFGQQQ